MYQPKFTITNKILSEIGRIEAAREIIENAPLVPAYEAKFRQEAIIRTVHHGTLRFRTDTVPNGACFRYSPG